MGRASRPPSHNPRGRRSWTPSASMTLPRRWPSPHIAVACCACSVLLSSARPTSACWPPTRVRPAARAAKAARVGAKVATAAELVVVIVRDQVVAIRTARVVAPVAVRRRVCARSASRVPISVGALCSAGLPRPVTPAAARWSLHRVRLLWQLLLRLRRRQQFHLPAQPGGLSPDRHTHAAVPGV